MKSWISVILTTYCIIIPTLHFIAISSFNYRVGVTIQWHWTISLFLPLILWHQYPLHLYFFEEFRFTCVLGTYGVCVIVCMTSLVVLCCYSFSLFFRYLRKSLYGMHPDLKYAGIMSNTLLHSILCTWLHVYINFIVIHKKALFLF